RQSVDPGTFSASLTLRPGVRQDEAETALVRVLESAAESAPSREELDRALRQAEAQAAYSLDGVTNQAFALLFYELLGDWRQARDHMQRLRSVTPEAVRDAARRVLRAENRTVGWFIPEGG